MGSSLVVWLSAIETVIAAIAGAVAARQDIVDGTLPSQLKQPRAYRIRPDLREGT